MAGAGHSFGVGPKGAGLALLIALVTALALLPAPANAATASWALEPSSVDFGTVLPGQTAPAPAQLRLVNTGEVRLFPTLVALTPSDDFGYDSSGCRSWLEPGASCAIEVTFEPGSSGPKEATLEVAAWEGTAPTTAAHLRGTGTPPTVTIDPATVSFGTIPASTGARQERTATVTNLGPGELSISNLEFLSGGAPAPVFGPLEWTWAENSCRAALTLPPGGSCVVAFSLGALDPATAEGELRIADNAVDSPQVIHVSGSVAAGPPLTPAPPSAAAPALTLSGHPAERTKARVAVFSFSGNQDTTRFECRLDKAAFRVCASPARYRALKPGKHRFWVRPIGTFPHPVLGPAAEYGWRVIGPKPKKHRHSGPRR
jgi:hypothetical protein